MAVNLNSINLESIANNFINNARSILQGEVAGSIRFLAIGLSALVIWFGVFVVSGWNSQSLTNLKSSQGRWRTLLMLADEYRNLDIQNINSGNNTENRNEIDVPTIFAQVSEMQLGSRVNRISPDGRNQSVEINRLYAEELTELETQLSSRGVKFLSAEIRALPSGNERLFTVTAIIGPVS